MKIGDRVEYIGVDYKFGSDESNLGTIVDYRPTALHKSYPWFVVFDCDEEPLVCGSDELRVCE